MGSEDALRMAGRTLGARRRSAEEPARANIAPRCVGAFGVPLPRHYHPLPCLTCM